MLLSTVCACVVCAACQESQESPSPQPETMTEKARVQVHDGTLVHMADSALLADMSVSDYHFVPHRAMLTTLGQQRLSRLASLMQIYGGTVRFSTDLADEKLIDQRVETIRTFLAEAGLDVKGEKLTRDMPGGPGMDAAQVILIKLNEGTYDPKKKSSAAYGGSGSAAGNTK
jgi:hypothetical protein